MRAEHEAVTIENLIWSWIKTLSGLIQLLQNRIQEDFKMPEQLIVDYQQLLALENHLQMHLSSRPCNPWNYYQWSQDFKSFLNQLTRRSENCLLHLKSFIIQLSHYNPLQ